MALGRMQGPWLLPFACLCLSLAGPLEGSENLYSGTFDPETGLGEVHRRTPEGKGERVAQRGHWAPEEIFPHPTHGARFLVIAWRSQPRAQYLRLEVVDAEEADEVRQAKFEALPAYFEGQVRQSPKGKIFELRAAAVGENFEYPYLWSRSLLRWTAQGLVPGKVGYRQPKTPAQILNRLAAHLEAGEISEADQLSRGLDGQSASIQNRWTLLRSGYGTPGNGLRQSLDRVVVGQGPEALAAADQLLNMALERKQP